MNVALCPLCKGTTNTVEIISLADLEFEYKRQLQLSVLSEFPPGIDSLSLLACVVCGLGHYAPLVAGSDRFYSTLAARPAYYTSDRWEFSETARRLQSTDELLDVGCGDGVSLRMAPSIRKRGLEFNAEAVRAGRLTGLQIEQTRLETVPAGTADVVTMFQVIEHLSDPASLLGDAIRVLRPGGRLFVSGPDDDTYIGAALHDPMNAPPHHLLRWRERTLKYLETLLPLKVVRFDREPVTAQTVYAFRRAQAARSLRRWSGGALPRYWVSPSMTLLRRA